MKDIISSLAILFLVSNIAISQCFDDGHSPFSNQGWLSCEQSVGPIPERGIAHWILYDLGEPYTVDSLYIWNHNVWGETGMGVKKILIDYSLDKNSWTTIGPYVLKQAPGSWKYTGDKGPSLNHAFGRFFLITVLSSWDENATCAGLGEIKFILGESVGTDDESLVDDEGWISPNPATDIINLHLGNRHDVLNVDIIDAVGHTVISIPHPTGIEVAIPIVDLNPGMYIARVQESTGSDSYTFIKME